MYLFVGLGNKGLEYEKTRHNIGFLTLNFISQTLKFTETEILKFSSSIFSFDFQINAEREKIICAKPQTFMNLSGKAVVQIIQFYKIPIEKVFVFHDDVDLPNGKIKFKTGGGDGGHNGLKSITQAIGGDYNRIRIGVGRPEHGEVADFVLSNFKKNELLEINAGLAVVAENLSLLLTQKFSLLSQKLTSLT